MMNPYNPARGLNKPLVGGGGFNPLAAGAKRYNGISSAPNQGPVANRAGYAQRDQKYNAYQQAMANIQKRRVG